MHSDRAPADLNPIQDKVVVLATYLGGVTYMEWKESHTNSGATSENRGRLMADHHAHLRNSPVIQRLDILPSRRSKRVMCAAPSSFRKGIFFCISAREQRKLGDPKKVWGTRWGIGPYTVKKSGESKGSIIANPTTRLS